MNNNELKQKIIHYEHMLQNPRSFSMDELSQLIDGDFFEIGQSAKIYDKEQVINYFYKLKTCKSSINQMKMIDDQFKIISEEVVLLAYKIEEVDLSKQKTTYSLRSSLWRNNKDHWVLIFHQGTLINQKIEDK